MKTLADLRMELELRMSIYHCTRLDTLVFFEDASDFSGWTLLSGSVEYGDIEQTTYLSLDDLLACPIASEAVWSTLKSPERLAFEEANGGYHVFSRDDKDPF